MTGLTQQRNRYKVLSYIDNHQYIDLSHRAHLISLILAIFWLGTSPLKASTWISIYLADSYTPIAWADPNVPYVYPEIMVGTELVLIVSSDSTNLGYCDLVIPENHWDQGQLFGRNYSELTNEYAGSITTAAGFKACVFRLVGSKNTPNGRILIEGFQFREGMGAVPGPWMILDYLAYNPGEMVINYSIMSEGFPPQFILLEQLIIPQVQTRDYDKDSIVTFQDFGFLAQQWQEATLEDPNTLFPLDLNQDQIIGLHDFKFFSDFWLVRTKGTDPNSPVPEVL